MLLNLSVLDDPLNTDEAIGMAFVPDIFIIPIPPLPIGVDMAAIVSFSICSIRTAPKDRCSLREMFFCLCVFPDNRGAFLKVLFLAAR